MQCFDCKRTDTAPWSANNPVALCRECALARSVDLVLALHDMTQKGDYGNEGFKWGITLDPQAHSQLKAALDHGKKISEPA